MADEIVPIVEDSAKVDAGTKPADSQVEWISHIPEEYKTEKLWESVKSKNLSEVLKGYAEAQKMIGGSIRLPKEGDAKGLEEIYTKLGRPAKPEEYGVKRAEDFPEELWDEKYLQGFLQTAHQLGLNKHQVESLVKWNGEHLLNFNAARGKEMKEAVSQLTEEWGGAATRNMALAQQAVIRLGGEEAQKFFRDSGLGNEPVMIKLFAKVGRVLLEEGLIDSADGSQIPSADEAVEKAQDIIHNEQNSEHKAYWAADDPRHQEVIDKVHKLLAVKHHQPTL